MQRRSAVVNALRALTLLFFAVFFGAPLLWIVLAPTRTGYQLATGPAFALGSLGHVAQAWQQLDAFGGHLFRRWMENSLLYTFSATALTLLTAIPAATASLPEDSVGRGCCSA